MARCTRREGLEVHHTRPAGGNGLDDAVVLCSPCHTIGMLANGLPSTSPRPFDEATKQMALRRAGFRCECTRIAGCH